MRARLHTPVKTPGIQAVLFRIAIIAALIFATVIGLWVEGGLVYPATGETPGFLDTLYFTMVTITTVGYGDIVPATPIARMVDTFFLTPIRFIIFILFVGIAYQLAFKRLQEDYRMSRIVKNLNNHIILLGYGETGRVAVEELLLQGVDPGQIVVIDTSRDALDEAASLKVIGLHGDGTRESVLKAMAIDRASHILISPGRDDTAALIALTCHDLNPNAQLVVMCHEEENVRLIQRTGAHTIVSSAGGNMLAAAARRPHLVDTMKDLLQIGGDVFLDERRVRPEEAGKHPSEIEEVSVIRVYRKGKHFNVRDFPTLEAGDIIVFVADTSHNDNEIREPEESPV